MFYCLIELATTTTFTTMMNPASREMGKAQQVMEFLMHGSTCHLRSCLDCVFFSGLESAYLSVFCFCNIFIYLVFPRVLSADHMVFFFQLLFLNYLWPLWSVLQSPYMLPSTELCFTSLVIVLSFFLSF